MLVRPLSQPSSTDQIRPSCQNAPIGAQWRSMHTCLFTAHKWLGADLRQLCCSPVVGYRPPLLREKQPIPWQSVCCAALSKALPFPALTICHRSYCAPAPIILIWQLCQVRNCDKMSSRFRTEFHLEYHIPHPEEPPHAIYSAAIHFIEFFFFVSLVLGGR